MAIRASKEICTANESVAWDVHLETRNARNEWLARFIYPQECAFGDAITPDYVIAVIRKLFARGEPRKLSHDTISFDDYLGAMTICHNPFATANENGFARTIMNGDEIDKREGPVWWRFQSGHIDYFVDRHVNVD